MTYTHVMYDMPPNKVGDKGKDDFWKLPYKPPGALAASCVINKYWEDIHAFHEEMFNEITWIIQAQMNENPVKKSGPIKRWIFCKIGLGFIIAREDMTAKDHAHEAYPLYEEISDEEWMRRATPIHYPYHTAASQKAYDEEMFVRRIVRAERWEKKFADYEAAVEAHKRANASKFSVSSSDSSKDSDWDSGSSIYTICSDNSSIFDFSSHSLEELKQALEDLYAEVLAFEVEHIESSDSKDKLMHKLMTKIEAVVEAQWKAEDSMAAVESDDSSASKVSKYSADSAEFLDSDSSTKVGSGSEPHSSPTVVESAVVDSAVVDSAAGGSPVVGFSDPDFEFEFELKREPNWAIKLDYDSDPNTGLLDFENDPFLTPADEVHLTDNDSVQIYFNLRNLRILEEAHARLYHHTVEKGGYEYQALEGLINKLVDAIETGMQFLSSESNEDEGPGEDEVSGDNNIGGKRSGGNHGSKNSKSGADDSDDDDGSEAPEWLRTCSQIPTVIDEALDMDTNPHRVGLVSMTEEEEDQYFAGLRRREEIELEQYQSEQERRARVAQEIQEQANGIQWLRTRDSVYFPTSPRVSTSPQRASPSVVAQDDLALPVGQQYTGMEVAMRTFDGKNLKCFSAGPHRAHQYEDDSKSSLAGLAGSPKKKSRIVRGFKKVKRAFRKDVNPNGST